MTNKSDLHILLLIKGQLKWKNYFFLCESLFIVMMHVTNIFVTACLIKDEIQFTVGHHNTRHKASSWDEAVHTYCVQVWLILLFNPFSCVKLHHCSQAMPIHCIAAGCDAKSGMRCSLYGFSKRNGSEKVNENKVIEPISHQTSQLCSKCFEDNCFVTWESVMVSLFSLPGANIPSFGYLVGASSTPNQCYRPAQHHKGPILLSYRPKMHTSTSTEGKIGSDKDESNTETYLLISLVLTTKQIISEPMFFQWQSWNEQLLPL